jgi:alanine racemase
MRPTKAEIDLKAISLNVKNIKKQVAPADVMAVVKDNAYGHGAEEVSRVSLKAGATMLAVSIVEEGIELREKGFTCPILVLGPHLQRQIELFLKFDLSPTISYLAFARELSQKAEQMGKIARVHIKIETGLNRAGFFYADAVPKIEKIVNFKNIHLAGVYTHFATSDEEDKGYAHIQLKRFKKNLQDLEKKKINPALIHSANSGAIIDMPDSYFDIVRPGVILYGYYPSPFTSERIELHPSLTLKSQITFLKKVEKGESISYGRKYFAPADTYIATIPIGYGDGYNRRMSNTGEVLIRGRRYTISGRVCMDIVMVDLGSHTDVELGDETVFLGRQGEDHITMKEVCQKLDTLPNEVCCWISSRVPRVYIHEPEI